MKTRAAVAVTARKPLEIMKLEDINKGFDLMRESIRSALVY